MQLKKVFLETVEDTIEFPSGKFVVSLNRPEKKMVFTPEEHFSIPNKIRTMVNMLKQHFNVLGVNSLEDGNDTRVGDVDDPNLRGTFEVEFDPRENFESAISFLRNQVVRDK